VLTEQGAYDTVIQRWLTPFALRHADLLIAQSIHLLDAVRRFGLDAISQRVIPIGVDCDRFQPAAGRSLFRERLAIPEDTPVVLSPRHPQSLYNIDLIIRAIPDVLAFHPQTIFVFKEYYWSETSGYQQACKALAHELGVADHVRWVEGLANCEMPQFYVCGDVAVSVAKSDGLPVSVLEAMACGLPLVLSPLPGLQSYLSQGEHALYVKSVEPATIATAISTLLDDEALRTRMGQANRTVALAKFDFVPIMESVNTLYRELSTGTAS
jgi:glycosyltransferase involved in cell wall biosynthesis